jgi:hypothetical protein
MHCARVQEPTHTHLLLLLCCAWQAAGAASAQAQYAATELRKLGADAITLKARASGVEDVQFDAAD